MNYELIYDRLIFVAKNRGPIDGYCEWHHIIPKCVGGNDSQENLVCLTPEEHYVAHQILIKMMRYRDHKNYKGLVFAANMMTVNRPGNKNYGWLKRKMSLTLSEIHSGRKQSEETILKRVSKTKGLKRTDETRKKISEAKMGVTRSPFTKEHKEKLFATRKGERNGMFGKTHSDDTKNKMSNAKKGIKLSEKRKSEISAQMKGRVVSDETRERQSIAAKKAWEKRRKEK